MIDEKTLREEFERHARYMALEGREVDLNWQTWKAAHAKYAPRWLPIDEADHDSRKYNAYLHNGSVVDIMSLSQGRVCNVEYDQYHKRFIDIFGNRFIDATHYMPIPDAPSNDA